MDTVSRPTRVLIKNAVDFIKNKNLRVPRLLTLSTKRFAVSFENRAGTLILNGSPN